MDMKKIINRRVMKLKVKDLKKKLEEADDESDVVLTFYMRGEGLYSVYLSEILTTLPYDSVLKEKQSEYVCELSGYTHEECSYIEDK